MPPERRRPNRETVPRPAAPERPFFDFPEIGHALGERVNSTVKRFGLDFGQMRQPEYKSRWPGIWGNLRHPIRGIISNEWYGLHPLKFLGALTTRNGVGRKDFRRQRNQLEIGAGLRNQYRQQLEAARQALGQETSAALASLQNAVATGQVNLGNRNRFFEDFNNSVEEAIRKFQREQYNITAEFEHAWRGKGRAGPIINNARTKQLKKSG